MSHVVNTYEHPEVKNIDELVLFITPEGDQLGNFRFTWHFIWLLIKAKFKKGKLFVWVCPRHNFSFDIRFYRQIGKENKK